MKNNQRKLSTVTYSNMGTAGPTAPVVRRTAASTLVNTDPASVQRTNRYPIPSFFEYRIHTREYIR